MKRELRKHVALLSFICNWKKLFSVLAEEFFLLLFFMIFDNKTETDAEIVSIWSVQTKASFAMS